MIIYKDIMNKLKECGYPTTRIRKEKLLSESTITKLRNNKPITMTTLNDICKMTGLPVSELVEYIPD